MTTNEFTKAEIEWAQDMKAYDIFLGRDNWYAVRVAQFVGQDALEEWLAKGYRIQSETQIGNRLHNVYLVKSK